MASSDEPEFARRGPRICLITERYPPDPGNVACYAKRVVSSIDETGYDMHVFVHSGAPPLETIDGDGIRPTTVRRVPSDSVRLRTVIDFWHQRIGFDLFHGLSIASASACVQATARNRRPLIVNITDVSEGAYQSREADAVLRHASWLIASSVESRECAHKAMDIALKSSVIPSPFDIRDGTTTRDLGASARMSTENMITVAEQTEYCKIYARLLDRQFLTA